MKRLAIAGGPLMASLALMTAPSSAFALVAAPPATPVRLAITDCVLVGKVIAIEETPVKGLPFPGAKEQQFFQVARVRVDELFAGPQGVKEIKVGFAPPKGPMGQPGGGLIISSGGGRGVALTKDQEACFYLTRNPEGTFYLAPIFYDVVDKRNPNFAKEVAQLRQSAKLLADPDASLKSQNADDRLKTALMLVSRYRTPPRGKNPQQLKTEPIDAGQSRLILETLAAADWNRRDQLSPRLAFDWLGLTPKEGWTRPKNPQQYTAAAQAWLQKNAATFRIQRYLRGE
jgi:hypothetical protein